MHGFLRAACMALAVAAAAGAGAAEMGVNLEGVKDWSRLAPFADLMKGSRAWGQPGEPWVHTVATDALGWPTQDAGVVVRIMQDDAGEPSARRTIAEGVYRLAFHGRAARVRTVLSTGVSVRGLVHDAATRLSTAEVVVGAGATQIMLAFEGTDGGVRGVSLLPPGTRPGQTFTDELREATAPFGTLRLMDFLETNGNPVRSWAERTVPAAATQAGDKGAAYEYAVQLANELDKDIWINIPVGADDAYVHSLAQLLKQRLEPGRAVYVEYSNELWNDQFSQTSANRDAAVAEALGGDRTLTRGQACTAESFKASAGECNPYWAGYFRVGKRTVRIAQIFSGVFGAAAMNGTVRVVYATQFADRSKAEQVLKYIARHHGKPSALLYGVAAAPYFYLDDELARAPGLGVDAIHASLERSLQSDVLPFFAAGITQGKVLRRGVRYEGGDWNLPTLKAVADHYGLKSIAYEGGPDLRQADASLAAKFAANADARMGAKLDRLLAQWWGCGNGLFVHFNLTSSYGRHGYWGLTNDPRDLRTPKYQAAAAAARRPAASYATCG